MRPFLSIPIETAKFCSISRGLTYTQYTPNWWHEYPDLDMQNA
jgi:hypothetical protein